MSLEVHLDSIDTLAVSEKFGELTQVTRQAIVSGLSGVLFDRLYAAMAAAGLPQYGAVLDGTRGAHLEVSSRDIKMLDRDTASVTITYDKKEGVRTFKSDGSGNASVVGKMTASVAQVEANMYKKEGQGAATTVIVGHTYPNDDPDFAGMYVQQTGQFKVFVPQKTLTADGTMRTSRPWGIVDAIIGCVNKNAWMNGAPRSWMCTEVTWEVITRTKYYMSFSFQHNADTWDPVVVFIDSRTNRPPSGLVKDTGYKTIKYHKGVDFMQHIGFRIAGA